MYLKCELINIVVVVVVVVVVVAFWDSRGLL